MMLLEDETTALVEAAWLRGLTTPPAMTVSEWADQNRLLPGANAEPGPWRTARVPYLREIMDCLSVSSPVERVVMMKGAQTGGTEAALNAIGYWIDHAPGSILAVWPSIDMVRKNSRTRIEPLVQDTPAIRAKIVPPRSREPGNTIALKEFPGGSLMMTGANSAVGLRSHAARYLTLDEVDAFPADADDEGDPVSLAIQRTVTFRGRRKIIMISTPTTAGVSRIERAYAESDQRRYHVPCPHCGEFQALTWCGVTWPKDEPARAFYACQECGGVIEEHQKPSLLAAGEWRPDAPGPGKAAGFHLSALYSPFESWGDIAVDFLASMSDPTRLKTWTNLKLGEAFEDRATQTVPIDELQARAEAAERPWAELLPDGVAVITAGVDVQDNRIEIELVGWGRNEESWSLDYRIIHGDPAGPEPWAALDALLTRTFRHPRDVPDLRVAAAAIDSGGHRTSQVMAYSAARLARRVWAIKGKGGPGVPAWPRRPPKPQKATTTPLHIVGVDGLKSQLFARLRIEAGAAPGACHFPADRDVTWFAGLMAERPVRKWTRGVARIEWIVDRGVRNEPLDCRVYATAALAGLGAAGFSLGDAATRTASAAMRADTEPPRDIAAPRAAVIRSRWVHG
ncbi:phage terminase large subunit family protein [Bosea vaviloviae]|uniref:Terminase n=1 Tax=Bosea vaviloviae TaxID=1526658 RepID=A0A0N1F556_9HYPH|nr:phage terminase large subunit family protein [Bosea vaviloviae]KPH80670.1 terminase [Bosea vaviloviae]